MQEHYDIIKEMGVLSEEAYDGNNFSVGNIIDVDNLQSTYTVVATHNELLGNIIPDLFGFQAMLLKDASDNYVIAFRGTELPHPWQTIADFTSDGSMAVGNFTQQMEYALRFVSAACVNQNVTPDQITLTGHSLGGSLAEIAGYTFGSQTYTYNPFGVAGVLDNEDYNVFLTDQQVTVAGQTDNIHNIVALGGDDPDFITGVGSHFLDSYIGEVTYIKDHDGGNSLGNASHGIGSLNESIAVYNNLLQLFPNEAYNSLTDKLDSVAPRTGQVERFLETLSELTGAAVDHSSHVAWSENIQASGSWNFVIEGFAETFPVNLPDEYLYALLRLNPYTITGADYSFLENNSFSDQYLEDRAAFLFQLTYPEAPSTTGDDMQFEDNILGVEAYAGNGIPDLSDRHFVFGSLEGELIEGDSGRPSLRYGRQRYP